MRCAALSITIALCLCAAARAAFTNNIMLVGYWPPTNEMLRPFSQSPVQNASGWTGGNWENRGFDIYSYFPEFPEGGGPGASGIGDFEVDYQDTDEDFARIVAQINPIAIITFSWTAGRQHHGNADWELEARNRNRSTWLDDYSAPAQPAMVPPDPTLPANAERYSSLPMNAIRDAVNTANVGVSSYIDDYSSTAGGSFLSEYLAYKALRYHDENSNPLGAHWNIAAGHIHVGQNTTPAAAALATTVTLRTLTNHLTDIIGRDPFTSNLTDVEDPYHVRQKTSVPAPAGTLVCVLMFMMPLRRINRPSNHPR